MSSRSGDIASGMVRLECESEPHAEMVCHLDRAKSVAALVADFTLTVGSSRQTRRGARTYHQSAPLLNGTAAPLTTVDLPGRLWLCRRCVGFRAFQPFLLRLFAFRCRPLHLDLLAAVVIANFVACAARDLRATVAIGLKAVLADQRTDAACLALDGVERIDAGGLHLQPHACMFVGKVEGLLRRRVPVAIDGAGVATDAAQFGLQ